jgi:hypothetical protein
MDQHTRKARLLDQIRAEHRRFDEAIAGLSEAQMTAPGAEADWSVKDIAAHLVFWQQRAIFLLECARTGWRDQNDRWGGASVDERNAQNYQAQHDRTLGEVLADLATSAETVLALLEATPEGDLFDVGRFGWLKGSTLAEAVSNETDGHYPEHLDSLRTWRAKQA